MQNITLDLESYARTWNRQGYSNRLIVTGNRAQCELSTNRGVVLFIVSMDCSRSARVSIQPEPFVNSGVLPVKEGFRILEQLVQMSWKWQPSTIRSNHLLPCLQRVISMFPRWGYQVVGQGEIMWCCDSANRSWTGAQARGECLKWCRQVRPPAKVRLYSQAHPSTEPVVTQEYDVEPPTPLPSLPKAVPVSVPEPSVSFEGVEDEEAGEGELVCSVCMTNKPCAAAKCNHLTTCATCAVKISQMSNPRCPKCRGSWTGLKRIYI